jgi:hypothetical protein
MPRIHMKSFSILMLVLLGLGGLGHAQSAGNAACMASVCCCFSSTKGHINTDFQHHLKAYLNQCAPMAGCCRIGPNTSSLKTVYLITRTKIDHQTTPVLLEFPDKDHFINRTNNVIKHSSEVGYSWPFVPLHLQKMSIIC